ncbi:MAG: hypothetical protein IKN43_13385 [Selenomonadaceae bacterium]|nr:hypothetical protein [Selenomonadaceae bacterium]
MDNSGEIPERTEKLKAQSSRFTRLKLKVLPIQSSTLKVQRKDYPEKMDIAKVLHTLGIVLIKSCARV